MSGHFSRNSIRARLTFSFSLATALLLLLTAFGASAYIRYDIAQDADTMLRAALSFMQGKVRQDPQDTSLIEFEGRVPTLDETEVADEASVAIVVLDRSGRMLRQTKKARPWPHPEQHNCRVETLVVAGDTIVAWLPWASKERAARKQTLLMAGLCGMVFIAVTGGVWLLVGQALSPLRRLSAQAQEASADSLRIQLSPSSQDAEIVELVDTLNGLLSRLSDAASARGRFYAAASHELRTPLQALSGHLELALTRPRPAEAYREALAEAQTQAQRLMSLVRDLLLLNQLDAGALPASEPIDLAACCDRALNQMAPVISARRLRIEADWTNETDILAPPTHLEMLIRNLIENAVKYAAEGGEVRISFTENGQTLEVFNASEPIPNWDSEKLFEPFYRLDASRNAKTGGNGLGLAICKAIADAHNWKIAVEQIPGGVRARVTFASN